MNLASLATTGDHLLVLLAIVSLGLWPAAVDRLSRSPRAARWDRALHRALGGDREVQP